MVPAPAGVLSIPFPTHPMSAPEDMAEISAHHLMNFFVAEQWCLCTTVVSRWLSENTRWKLCVMPPLPQGTINIGGILTLTAKKQLDLDMFPPCFSSELAA